MDAFGKKGMGLLDLENLVGGLGLAVPIVPQATPLDECENQTNDSILRYSLSLFNLNGHTEETAWGNIVRGFLALPELCSLLDGQYLLQLA